jgi:hypothetical protein
VDETAAATVRRVFEGFAEIGSVTRLLPILRAEGRAYQYFCARGRFRSSDHEPVAE